MHRKLIGLALVMVALIAGVVGFVLGGHDAAHPHSSSGIVGAVAALTACMAAIIASTSAAKKKRDE